MKSVEILISNFNSGEAIELCIESIRKFTAYPHTITVRDDGTWTKPMPEVGLVNGYGDLDYLRAARDRGWIKLIDGQRRLMHGSSLNVLLDQCQADLAMIIDCDIQVLSPGWLEEMVETQARTNAAMMTVMESFPDDNICAHSWWVMIDMAQYPRVRDDWEYCQREDGKPGLRATGYRVYKNVIDRGLVWIPTPPTVTAKYRHFTHMSVLSAPQSGPEWEVRVKRYAAVQGELRKLRAGK
jgi:glycosyltransferase involved in cell wall biosynthesis